MIGFSLGGLPVRRTLLMVTMTLITVPVAVATDRVEMRLPGARIDPLVDVGALVEAAARADDGSELVRVIQLRATPRSEVVDRWQELGIRIVAYYPPNTYLVRAARAAVDSLGADVVRWSGVYQPAWAVDAQSSRGERGVLVNASVDVAAPDALPAVVAGFEALGAIVRQVQRADAAGHRWLVGLDRGAADVEDLASIDGVVWLGPGSSRIQLEDEMSDQIVAGNHPGGQPVVGYGAHLGGLGVTGAGVIWTVADTGVDWDHPSLVNRLVGGLSPPDTCQVAGEPGTDCSSGGHGTHVAGIVGADATAAHTDVDGFLYGLGVAPGVSLFAFNVFSDVIDFHEITGISVQAGAIGANNSWSSTGIAGVGYTAHAVTQDTLVRDGDLSTPAVAEPFIQVFSAGNSGGLGASSITEPKEAKNIISVANSRNARSGGDIDTLSGTSSRGPALDGRILPTVTAPGTNIASTRNDLGGSCAVPISGTSNLYALCSGTSMAAPHVSGVLALAAEWWRAGHGGADFSPAMAKALLVNSAVDMGTPDIPNNDEGWGRVTVTRLLQPAARTIYIDQTHTFTDTAHQWQKVCPVADPGQPLKVTLAYTDAPAGAGANPTLVNDLDLTVVQGANTWRGNVFSAGWSITGGIDDDLDNLENVFVQSPADGLVAVTVDAEVVAGDGVPYDADPTDQDFALVCFNCNGCFDAVIFQDGFEGGNSSQWSATVP